MDEQNVILVDIEDKPLGVMKKMEAHRTGALHRAFSIFIFDARGRMLLQKRSSEKYHGGGLWTNACCSHPLPEESIEAAARRRLFEELGFSTDLKKLFSFTYEAEVENGLIEHEFDHVFIGRYDQKVHADPHEVADYAYEDMERIKWAIENQPSKFTSWFKLAFPRIEEWWEREFEGNKSELSKK